MTDHSDPQGWYLATVTNYQPDGQVQVTYSKGDSELLSLKSTRWCLTRSGGRHYLPPTTSNPKCPLKNLREEANKTKFHHSIPHTVKAFADDLTVLSKKLGNHHEALAEIEPYCTELDLELRPDKCVPLAIDDS